MGLGGETMEIGGEVAERVGQGLKTISVGDSRLWEPSLSTAAEKNTQLLSVMRSCQ